MKFKDIDKPSDKNFGYFLSSILFIATTYSFFFYENNLIYTLFFFTALILFITLINPKIIHPLNIIWMYLGFLLGKIVSPLVLGLIFYVIITPTAMILNILKRDELKLKTKKLNSYWVKRDNLLVNKNFFDKQF